MKTTMRLFSLKAALPAILATGILLIFGLAGCASTGGGSASGTHNMGNLKNPSTMSNQDMPGR